MAKIVKKKKRKLSFVGKAIVFFVFSLVLMLGSSLYFGTRNASLSIKIQKMNNEIAAIRAENQNLNIEIQTLQNKERVYTIAQDAGLDQSQDNIVSVRED
ncbi:MAG: hypothetical protein IIZ47_02910 [Erysipelotrichaceae bacterium]|nr:hypothetical protein [Erysipelotrichaceae bacterium]